jgi:5-methyltetrahydrofolate--homocysteine methyltransferase
LHDDPRSDWIALTDHKEKTVMSLEELATAVETGKRVAAENLTRKALEEGVAPTEVLSKGLILAMSHVGEKFAQGEYFVPEMLMAAKSMKSCMEILRPHLVKADFKPLAKVVLGTVRGDLHDIGKNLVKVMLEGGGFEVVDLGVDVAPEKFVAAVKEHKPQVVGMSALLTTTMLSIGETIKALDAAGVRASVRVIIGGAAVTEEFAKETKADAYGADAYGAVLKAKELLGLSAA